MGSARKRGTVKWFSDAKGYGFIGMDLGGDIFVHYTGINDERRGVRKTLHAGQRVEFNIEIDEKKRTVARNVARLDKTPAPQPTSTDDDDDFFF